MLLLIVFGVVVVLALAVLGSLGYSLLGAVGRVDRELRALEQEVAPVAAQLQAAVAAAAASRQRPSDG